MQVQDSKKDLAEVVLGVHDRQDGHQKIKSLEVSHPIIASLLKLSLVQRLRSLV